jgi:hypothetical protein
MSSYLTVSFIGVLIVLTYAWQRFNEPSFPKEETLPRTFEPLRYLFLKPAYGKARLSYLVGLLVLYVLLVIPGQSMIGALGGPSPKDGLSPQAWPLLAALILTGLGTAPTSVMAQFYRRATATLGPRLVPRSRWHQKHGRHARRCTL